MHAGPVARCAAGLSSLPLAPRGAADSLLAMSPSIILSPIRMPAAGLGPLRGSSGGGGGTGKNVLYTNSFFHRFSCCSVVLVKLVSCVTLRTLC